jgi:membrane protein DedA with SNARE-associated domain
MSVADLEHLSLYAYLVIAAVAAGDAILPVLPAETLVIFGGVLAAQGHLSLALVIVAGTLGAALGDNTSYQIGHVANRSGKAPEDISGRFGRALAWSEAALAARGASMLVVGRFIPGGRTALSFGAGYVRFPRLRFALTSLGATTVWATYGALIGVLGGRVFERRWYLGLALGVAVTLALTLLVELSRKVTGHGVTIAEKRLELQARRAERATLNERAVERSTERAERPGLHGAQPCGES